MLKQQTDAEISGRIFSSAPNLLAVCLTAVGLIKIYAALQRITTLADNFLILCLIAFLAATFFSYLSLRSSHQKRRVTLETIADILFLSGLAGSTLVAGFIVFSLQG